jgi:hypothetical protein
VVFASSPAIGTCLPDRVAVENGPVRIAITSKKFFVGFRFMDAPCLGKDINLFLRGLCVIAGVISGSWGRARNFRWVRRIVGTSRHGIHVVLVVSVAGSDRFIFGVDRGPCIHRSLGAMPVARWSASIEWPIVVEHYANTEMRRVVDERADKGILGPTPVKSRRSMTSA